jgi:hypothetical protein
MYQFRAAPFRNIRRNRRRSLLSGAAISLAALAMGGRRALQARALLSPVDGSGLALLGAVWSPYQGLTLSAYASAMAGDGNDLYAWDYGGPALTLGAEFVF